jgi:holo-[acyl-carrier protein] synthase
VRIGIDLLDVARFGRVAAHPGGRRIVFTTAELAYADTLAGARRAEHLAGRFCAKEATAKLLGSGFGQGLVWRDIAEHRECGCAEARGGSPNASASHACRCR